MEAFPNVADLRPWPDAAAAPAPPAPAPAPPLWLCLDEVADPQNFGAALRCAHFLGAAGVLTCHRNSAPLSGVVSKASAGAMELMSVHSCRRGLVAAATVVVPACVHARACAWWGVCLCV